MLVGKVVAAGLAAYYKDVSVDLSAMLEAGMPEGSAWSMEGLLKLVLKAVNAGVKTGIPFGGRIIAVEKNVGGAYPDLVWRNEQGGLEFCDHKVSLNLDSRYLSQRLQQYNTSWQLFDYAWRIEQVYGEPVKAAYVHQIILHPKCQAILHPIILTPERLLAWSEQALAVSEQMDYEREHPEVMWQNWTSCTNNPFTQDHLCDFYDACHVLGGNESKFYSLYDVKQVREE